MIPKIPRIPETNPEKSLNHFRSSADNSAKINPVGRIRYFRSSSRYSMSFLDFNFELFLRISIYIIKNTIRMESINMFKKSYLSGIGVFFSKS